MAKGKSKNDGTPQFEAPRTTEQFVAGATFGAGTRL